MTCEVKQSVGGANTTAFRRISNFDQQEFVSSIEIGPVKSLGVAGLIGLLSSQARRF